MIPNDVQQYLNDVDDKRRVGFLNLFDTIQTSIPNGFKLCINYNMIGWVVPLERYPDGYHVQPNTPLPFINLAVQKRHIGLYHLGLYSDAALLEWFQKSYTQVCTSKLNMGKSCVRFTNVKKIPFALIGELASKMTVQDWIGLYESAQK